MRVPFGQTALRFLIGQKTSRFQFLTNYQTQSTEKADRFQLLATSSGFIEVWLTISSTYLTVKRLIKLKHVDMAAWLTLTRGDRKIKIEINDLEVNIV